MLCTYMYISRVLSSVVCCHSVRWSPSVGTIVCLRVCYNCNPTHASAIATCYSPLLASCGLKVMLEHELLFPSSLLLVHATAMFDAPPRLMRHAQRCVCASRLTSGGYVRVARLFTTIKTRRLLPEETCTAGNRNRAEKVASKAGGSKMASSYFVIWP